VSGAVSNQPDFDAGGGGRCRNNSWQLVGRRHSVDERRDQVQQGKNLLLRSLAADVDKPWHERADSQAVELAEIETRLRAEIERQVQLATSTKDFWCGSFAASRSYLSNLERVTVASVSLPCETEEYATEQLVFARTASVHAEAWVLWLPSVCEKHGEGIEDANRIVGRAMQAVKTATELVHTRRQTLFPKCTDLTLPNGHSTDNEAAGLCLWLGSCQYLAACEALEESHQGALAQLRRQEKLVLRLSRWLDGALLSNEPGGDVLSAPSTPALLPAQPPPSPIFGKDEAPLASSVELASLVVHEVDAEVCHDFPRETSSESIWVPVHLLLSVDLRLHIWEKPGMDYHLSVAPCDSVDLLRECNRPVAVRSHSSSVVQIAVRPDQTQSGFMANLGRVLWNGPTRPPRRGLQFRCATEAQAGELLAAFDLIEQLYPSSSVPQDPVDSLS